MLVVVLISCMYQKDTSILKRSNIQTDAVVVNQCDEDKVEEFDFTNQKGEKCHVKFISTKERGLSRSRNMAIKNAWGDICLICDDDEELVEDYESIILSAYKHNPRTDVMSFAYNRNDKTYPSNSCKLDFKLIMRTSSVEITFNRNVIVEHDILFDVKMGSGTGNGGGEENMFLMACKRKGLKMLYSPQVIGRLLSTDSLWFSGYTDRYFQNLGWSTRRIMGDIKSILFIAYFSFAHYGLYKKDTPYFKAVFNFFKGWGSKR